MKTAAKDFKMTELGPIPKNWEVKRLGELLEFKNGYNTDASNFGKGVPFASVLDALSDRPATSKSILGRVVATRKAEDEFSLTYGDLIFTRSSETLEDVGRSNVYVDRCQGAIFGGFVIRGRPIFKFDSVFLNYLLKDGAHRIRVYSQGAGAQHYNIGQTGLGRVSVTLPPFPEQRKIAAALSDVDEMIVALEKLIEKKRKVRVSTACDLIEGRRRLVVHNEEFKDSEVGRIPRDWDVLPLRELFDLRMEKNTNGEMRMILSVMKDIGVIPYAEKGNVGNRAKDDLTQYLIARVGDVVMNSMNVIIGSVGVTKWDGCISPAYYALTPKENANSIYYNAWFSRPSTQARIKERACGMMEIRLKIGIDDLLDMRFPVPSVAEQKLIAKVLGDMDAEIAALEEELAKTRQLKQGMMQELLTGKVRLKG